MLDLENRLIEVGSADIGFIIKPDCIGVYQFFPPAGEPYTSVPKNSEIVSQVNLNISIPELHRICDLLDAISKVEPIIYDLYPFPIEAYDIDHPKTDDLVDPSMPPYTIKFKDDKINLKSLAALLDAFRIYLQLQMSLVAC